MFLEEHPDSMNDPAFFSPSQSQWVDQPASFHDGAANFAFADGHVEMHMWQGSLITPTAQRTLFTYAPHAPAAINDSDLHWVSYHSPRVSTNSY
jgi:prepilin-type processing-associated H-X9-DG protein